MAPHPLPRPRWSPCRIPWADVLSSGGTAALRYEMQAAHIAACVTPRETKRCEGHGVPSVLAQHQSNCAQQLARAGGKPTKPLHRQTPVKHKSAFGDAMLAVGALVPLRSLLTATAKAVQRSYDPNSIRDTRVISEVRINPPPPSSLPPKTNRLEANSSTPRRAALSTERPGWQKHSSSLGYAKDK